jgi:hypothetical protein
MIKKQFTILILTAIICISCDNYTRYYPNSFGGNRNSGDYIINPDNILMMIDQESQDIFLPLNENEILNEDLLPYGSFSWTQQDYLEIANALSKYVWNDNMEGWEIYLLFFRRDCSVVSEGFDSFTGIYYKEIVVESEKKYTTRQIGIYPLAKQVTWGDGSNYPHSFFRPWRSMDFENFEITADEALQIADANGGESARIKQNNDCSILVSLFQDHPNQWEVDYHVDFHILINPYNGKFQIPPEELLKSLFVEK